MTHARSSHHALNTMQTEELKKLRAKSPVIQMTSAEIDRFTAGDSRPYDLVVFFNAPKIKEAKSIKLKEIFEKFKHIAKIARTAANKDAGHAASTVFFVELDMEVSRDTFMRFGVSNLPWVTHVGKDMRRECAFKSPDGLSCAPW